ncbi:MAG TPA: DUF262 domain-containing HNH endonuclease family protein [Smithella sp.]|nr:DUF262 domain-containing HNH endonuclease family protein [Smithella sp.]
MIPTELTFANLISIEGNQWHYHIPRFQREYVWRKNNWSKLLEDIYDNDPGHYMGSIICVNDATELSPTNELIYEVVDGQQRLTTLSILLACIYSKLLNEVVVNNPDIKQDHDYIIKLNSISQRLIKKVSVSGKKLPWGIFKSERIFYCLRVQPSTQENNLEDYQYILKEVGLLPNADYPRNCGNRRLYKAFKYFLNHISDDYDFLNDLLDRVYRLSFIHISEASQSKAFMLFETLNYRGVPLSAIDIIKNKMLSTLESKYGEKIEDSYDEWQEILNNIPEEADQDRFLRQFYNAFKYDKKIKIDKITRATRSNIISIYENLIKKNAKDIFDQLKEKAEIYNQLIDPEEYRRSALNNALVNLARISAVPSYTFLLYLFSLDDSCFDDSQVKEKVVELLCKYYFRRNITDYPNTRDLDAINIDLIEQCQNKITNGKEISYSFISKVVLMGKGKPSSSETLKDALLDNLFYNNEGMARYALARLDETSHTREYAPNLWERNEKGLYVWTVEHIFPQGKNIPTDWVEMIADGDREKAEKIQDEWVHCLGNLTLSGYNSKLSNQSFKKKQEKSLASVFGNKIRIGFKNGLALNNIEFPSNGEDYSLATTKKWTVDHINSRNKIMVKMLLKLFKFDNE